ncbi:MAG: hypothetical protein ACFFD4_02475 [Candidatus Odinarchaeota archaeon]
MPGNPGTYEEGWVGPDGQTLNWQTGCGGGCEFCFARLTGDEKGWCKWENWTSPVIRMKDVTKGYRRRSGRIMMPSSHNIDQTNVMVAVQVLRKLLDTGNKDILVVMKSHPDVITTLCKELEGIIPEIELRHSIPTLDEKLRKVLMPGCPTVDQMLLSVETAKQYKARQSVNVGPYVCAKPWEVVEKVVELGIKPENIWMEPMSHRTKLYKRSAVLRKYKDQLERIYSPTYMRKIKNVLDDRGLHIRYKQTFLNTMARESDLLLYFQPSMNGTRDSRSGNDGDCQI